MIGFLSKLCHTYSSFSKITDNWKNTTALWNKFKKNLTAVRSQNNFWIIKPFYRLTILSFSFYLSSSILPPAGGHTLDRAPFTGLCWHLFIWPSYILFWFFHQSAHQVPQVVAQLYLLNICFTLSSPQVSNQCMALVGDNCLVPTIDKLGLSYVQ